jgi:hypothetical protein
MNDVEKKKDCYVYYKSAQELESQVVLQVELLQKHLNAQMMIDGRLQRRPGAEKGIITWMEIYRDVASLFDTSLEKALNQTELMSLIQGERHAEYFEDAFSCV